MSQIVEIDVVIALIVVTEIEIVFVVSVGMFFVEKELV
jgi:hypothetical protein